jgi:hypothetical protein
MSLMVVLAVRIAVAALDSILGRCHQFRRLFLPVGLDCWEEDSEVKVVVVAAETVAFEVEGSGLGCLAAAVVETVAAVATAVEDSEAEDSEAEDSEFVEVEEEEEAD